MAKATSEAMSYETGACAILLLTQEAKLTILSAAIVGASFLVREILRDKLKDLKDRIGEAEKRFSDEANNEGLHAQLESMKMDAATANSKAAVAKARRTENYSQFILQDRLSVASRRGHLKGMEEAVLRLLNALPKRSRRKSIQLFAPYQAKVKQAIDEALAAEKASSERKDWGQTAVLKTHIMKLAFVEIEIALFAAGALEVAKKVREAAEHLYRICNRIWYVLAALGLGVAVYATLAGVKGLIGGE
jgi:hypothetical protein